MKRLTLALVVIFGAFGLNAEAQTCEVLCKEEFWKRASQAEISAEMSKTDVNAREATSETVLMYVAVYGTSENVQVLLDAGADVNARAENGMTALFFAAGFGTAENLKVLLDAGAEMNAVDENGITALMFAAMIGTAEKVKVLLDAGADSSMKDSMGWTAWNYLQFNDALKDTDVYSILNDARSE